MNRINTIKVFGIIIILAFGWAVLANRLINTLSEEFAPGYSNWLQIINNCVAITLAFTTMYTLVTKQRKHLKAAGEHYDRLFENIPAPIFIYDAATYKFLATNRAAELQYGYTKEEFLTLTLANMRVQGKLKSLPDIDEPFATKEFQSAYWLHEDKFGNSFYVCVYTCDTVFNNKHAKQAMMINIDETVKAELAFKEKKSKAETARAEIKNNSIPHLV
jgi:PAS domain S-box-containing protein